VGDNWAAILSPLKEVVLVTLCAKFVDILDRDEMLYCRHKTQTQPDSRNTKFEGKLAVTELGESRRRRNTLLC
jgi:hypothetical protein